MTMNASAAPHNQNISSGDDFPMHQTSEYIRHAATSDTRYFSACTRCHELTNAGHMHDAQTCQTCAERHLGVVH